VRYFTLFSAIMVCLMLAWTARVESAAEKSAQDRMAIAQAQHDLMVLLIDKGEFDKVPAELQKVLDLNFKGKDEQRVVDEILILSELLVKKGQATLSLRLVDMGLGSVREKDGQVKLYKEKGFLFKTMGQPDKAMEMFEKVRTLESPAGGK
jgi:tetratricopeptide (TPR) repeat protein